MSFSYSGDPANSNNDKVRFLIQDTVQDTHQIEDEEIAWLLTQEVDVFSTAAALCEVLANKYAVKADMYVGDLRIAHSQKSIAYRKQAVEMRKLATRNSTAPSPYAGGTSLADKELDELNTDVPKRFRVGEHDFPGVNERNNTYDSELE